MNMPQPCATPADIETPALLLDASRLEQNCLAFRERARSLGVQLRPHVKTAKSVDVALEACGGRPGPITVSTLLEAEQFAQAGFTDILWAQGVTPDKIARLAAVPARMIAVTDCVEVAHALARSQGLGGRGLRVLIEIDSGEHRAGLLPDDPALVEIGHILHAAPHVALEGVMTHAGHSYGAKSHADIARIADDEREAAVAAARALRREGLPAPVVSVGSTPTFRYGRDFEGITEVRAGVYVFYDLSQAMRGVCSREEIALSVLSTVIGHNRQASRILLDAGGLALSKDAGATGSTPSYGELLSEQGEALGLSVNIVYQEHGVVEVPDSGWFERIPVGSRVRVLPNHACMTAAGGYHGYHVTSEGRIISTWARFNGW